jgi:hypothetical protein
MGSLAELKAGSGTGQVLIRAEYKHQNRFGFRAIPE